MKRIVIFASGSGTNAENIIKYFQKTNLAEVTLVLSNKSDAKVLDRAEKLSVSSESFTKSEFIDSAKITTILRKESPDLIVLAGFLLKFPEFILKEFPNKVINIHPALLPKYGGKGMYGMHIHKSVVKNKESETGITIHYVNENYDEGAVIFQERFQLSENDTAASVASKIHELEYELFPKVIEEILKKDK
jgi:phosphoribosylglycinamide formyltransferase-1|tara:strand:+ start:105 stop:677 length:573 start_codon:yes stop_codon:yes gene_type:complete